MNNETQQRSPRCWTTRRDEKRRRLQLISSWMSGLLLPREKLVESLEVLIAPEIGSCWKATTRSRLTSFHARW